MELVDQAGGEHEARAQQEVAQLAHAAGGGEQQVDQVLHQADRHAADRPEGERRDQRRKLGEIQLDEADGAAFTRDRRDG